MTQRKVIDCRWYPSDSKCSLLMTGTEEELVRAAAAHAVAEHGEVDSPELRQELRSMLVDEPAAWVMPRPPAEDTQQPLHH
jgi:hypothetical protein